MAETTKVARKAVKISPKRQKTVAPGQRVSSRMPDVSPWDGGAPSGSPAQKRVWPVFEIVVVLVLLKISIGAWYVLSANPAETVSISENRSEIAQMAQPEPLADVAVTGDQLQGGAAMGQLETVASAGAPSGGNYLAAAVGAISPAVAEAASPAPSISPVSAGALMVIGAQAAAAPMAQTGVEATAIPLPPNVDLLTPAAQLPPSTLPALGTTSRDTAALPPSAAQSSQAGPDSAALRAMREREQVLARKEADLATREEALTALDANIRRQTEAMDAFRGENEAMIKRNEALLAEMKALREEQKKEDAARKDARIQQLVVAYKGMKPEQAGNLVNSLDDDVAVSILSSMPGRNAGLILAYTNPDKAAKLTKAISERRIDPDFLVEDNQGQPAPPEQQ